MFPLSHMLRAFVRIGRLTIVDADGETHVFAGAPGPEVTARITDRRLYTRLLLNPGLAAGEAYMDGGVVLEGGSSIRDFLVLFSVNRNSLRSYPLQKALRSLTHGLRRFQQMNPVGKAEKNVAHHYDIGNDCTGSSSTTACSIPAPISGARPIRWRRRKRTSSG